LGAVTELLKVENLYVRFDSKEETIHAVNGVDLTLNSNSILALVGESGSGKTVTALAMVGLLPYPGRVTAGSVSLNGDNLLKMKAENLRRIRGKEIGMVFQDPRASLNPSIDIGTQVQEVLLTHTSMTKRQARQRSEELLVEMGLPDAERILKQYPFQLSGGMCQRVMLSMALALRPKILIADEPTSNLDTTLQAAILNQLRKLKEEHGTAILLITHDMGVVAQMADSVAVMYGGTIVEYAKTLDLFERPAHPYTWGLFQALPRLDNAERSLMPMRGRPPEMREMPDKCPFLNRCPKATDTCRNSPIPALRSIEEGHMAACFNELRYD